MIELTPWKTIWCRFSDYHKFCDVVGMRGSVYGLVWNKSKPEDYQLPYEFKGCVYIGESGGNYFDKQNGIKGKFRSHLHKRMTTHHKPLTTGKTIERKYQLFIDAYGYGDSVLNGGVVEEVLWLGLTLPRKSLPDNAMKGWQIMEEHRQILGYTLKYGYSPLMNVEVDGKGRNEKSYSTSMLQTQNALEKLYQ